MDLQRIFSTVIQTVQTEGHKGLFRVVAQSFAHYFSFNKPESIFEDHLLFRYGSCNDLISLKAKYLMQCYDFNKATSQGWGLKQLGTLFCLEKYNQVKPHRVLEVGAGCNTFFDENIAQETEYWIIDDIGFYDESKFNNAADSTRKCNL